MERRSGFSNNPKHVAIIVLCLFAYMFAFSKPFFVPPNEYLSGEKVDETLCN